MGIVAIISVANMAAANAALAAAGHGPKNFSVPSYTAGVATHAALHAWDDPVFSTAIKAVAGVVFNQGSGDPIARTKTLIEAQGAKWGAQAPALPTTGNVTAGSLCRFEDALWSVIQTFNRSTYGAHPSTYPALIRSVRDPQKPAPWRQPLDQYDSYKLVNPFTNAPDTCTHAGKTWRTKVDVNVWEPAVGQLWEEIDAKGNVVKVIPPPVEQWPAWKQPAGGHDVYKIGDKVTFGGKRYVSKINANVWSPTGYPAGWTLQP